MGELEKFYQDVYNCGRCGTCARKFKGPVKGTCPVREHSSGFESTFSRGRTQVARAILEGDLEYTPQMAQRIYECLLCGNCRQACGALDPETLKPCIDVPAITKAMRADIFASGVAVPAGVKMLGEGVEKSHNVLGAPHETRTDWVTPDIKLSKNADLIYFPGCITSYKAPEVARATAKILNKADVPFSILGEEEWCCGDPLLMTGQLDLAKEVARHNYELLKGKRVVASCAGCFRTLQELYPQLLGEEYQLDAVHTSQLLAELIESGKLKFKAHKGEKKKVTYHDPCELGRDMKIFDEPRTVIQAIPGVELVEMARHGADAWCCGGGGGVKAVNYALSLEISKDKISDALETGAKTIVSGCPSCKQSISDAIKATGADLKVIDITELVAEALGL